MVIKSSVTMLKVRSIGQTFCSDGVCGASYRAFCFTECVRISFDLTIPPTSLQSEMTLRIDDYGNIHD